MSLETKHIYEFDDFCLDLEQKVLLREGKRLPVTPKVFHLLTVLVENHGRVVEKEKLLAEIWAGSFVEEGNLAFNVRMLRKALGDEAANPRFIETIPRRGYCFIAQIKEDAPKPEENLNQEHVKTFDAANRARRKMLLPAAALVLIFLLIGGAASWFNRNRTFAKASSAPVLSEPFRSVNLSTSGKVHNAVISPDGKLVAYTSESGGKASVWLRKLETSENVQIIAPEENQYFGMFFAHDGQSLYFVRKPIDDNSLSAIYKFSIFSRSLEKIIEKTEGWISLAPDDKQISFVRCEHLSEDNCSLFVADTSGKNERKIVTRPKPFRIGDNQFSPDGLSIAFAAGQSSNGENDFRLMQINIEKGEQKQLSPKAFFNIKNLEWLPDGNELILTAIENFEGKLKIWRVATATGETEALTKDATDYVTLNLNKDADKLLATQVRNNFQLYFSANGETRALAAALTFSFAPDGRLVYSSPDSNIWTINRDGTEQKQLTVNSANDFFPVASPDNKFIYFVSNRSGANQVWRMNRDGGNQIQLTKTHGGYPHFVSPDGQTIFYESGLEQTLWKVSSDGNDETRVSDTKMFYPAFSPDGNLVAYFFRNKEWKIGVIRLSDQKIVKTFDYGNGKSRAVSLNWSADNQTLYFFTENNGKNVLWQQALSENEPQLVADYGRQSVQHFAYAPDNGGLAYISGDWLHDAVLITGLK